MKATDEEFIKAWEEHQSPEKVAKALGMGIRSVHRRRRKLEQKTGQPFLVGTSTLYGPDGEIKLQWIKEKASEQELQKQVDKIIQSLSIPKFKPIKPPKFTTDDLYNVYVFGDPHIDMLAWAPESGQDWDLDIAVERHISAMTDMVNRSPKCNIGILATMGDLFHRDSMKAITPNGGNIVDVDGRLSRSWDRGVEMIRAMIDKMLKKYQRVVYICVRGNHSETLELILAKTIRIAYENEPRVEVLDNTPKEIPYSIGRNFLLFVHGDGLNDQKKAGMVTSRYRKEHGQAAFSHVLSGHLHHAYQKEMNGVLVEIFPVLPSADAWHCANGYMMSDQAATVVTYHERGGVVGRTTSNPRVFLGEAP